MMVDFRVMLRYQLVIEAERLTVENAALRKAMYSSAIEPCKVHDEFNPGCVPCISTKAAEANSLRTDLVAAHDRVSFLEADNETLREHLARFKRVVKRLRIYITVLRCENKSLKEELEVLRVALRYTSRVNKRHIVLIESLRAELKRVSNEVFAPKRG